ncbi:MAG TPA: hypothetical protein VM328_07535 [Fimbriimonadaceae bacterium]|nr:hypothetical protein [Fimbriimonadaceae bacterium]
MIFVTGFGPFGDIADNPSSELARAAGCPFEILEVSYRFVEDWLASLDLAAFETLLLIGVAAKADKMRIEMVARNTVGGTADVRGEVWGPMAICPRSAPQLSGSLWRDPELLVETEDWVASVDAGTYLCNYVYFRALQRFPDNRVGFLHVPRQSVMPMDRQHEALRRIMTVVSSRSPAAV